MAHDLDRAAGERLKIYIERIGTHLKGSAFRHGVRALGFDYAVRIGSQTKVRR
jgi:hypothetical protein